MNKINLRKVFVQLLFSLAIGQVALRSGDLVVAGATIESHYYSYLHLLLCVIIITSSWVGWHNSKSPHNSDTVESVIGIQYVILLVDLFLVVCYFIIVNASESNKALKDIPSPSSYIEVLWTAIIFSTYLLWDFITKLFEFKFDYNNETKTVTRKLAFTKILPERVWPTLLCCIISWIIFKYMHNEVDKKLVALIDVTLIALFFMFRGLKQEVKKIYEVQKKQISEELVEELTAKDCNLNFPIKVQEGKKIFILKYCFTKILPGFIVLSCFITYLKIK